MQCYFYLVLAMHLSRQPLKGFYLSQTLYPSRIIRFLPLKCCNLDTCCVSLLPFLLILPSERKGYFMEVCES